LHAPWGSARHIAFDVKGPQLIVITLVVSGHGLLFFSGSVGGG